MVAQEQQTEVAVAEVLAQMQVLVALVVAVL
jgi:hypothetical protein